jgi:hypothetical protein
MLNHPDHHPRNITQTWKQHNYNNNSTGLRQLGQLGIYRESVKFLCTCTRQVVHSDGKVGVEEKSIIHKTHQAAYVTSATCPSGSLTKTSCNLKHCTLTVTSTRTYYPKSERRTVTIRSSGIYPANKENNCAHFHL